MASDSDGDFEKSEIEIPTVVGLIRNILTQYPDSGQILKELIQNAEDARAAKVEVTYVAQGCSTDGVKDFIKPFIQGPGLCLYNDGVFGKEDWKGIKRLSESVKKADPTTVGRFGLGFKSVFHFTDYVTVLSDEHVLFMDPSEQGNDMCRIIKLDKLNKYLPDEICCQLWGQYLNQHHLRKGKFQGTIFWFPLRQTPSKISDTVYTQTHVKNLFESFATEGSMTLIFLRSLEKLTLLWKNTAEKTDITTYLEVQLTSLCLPEILKTRQQFCSQLVSYMSDDKSTEKISCKYIVNIKTLYNKEEKNNQYIILHYLAPKSHSLLLNNSKNYINNFPLVGVAAPINECGKMGQLFCFLPLPLDQENNTGLPVLVNGYFVLNQNRRHVQWRSADTKDDKDVEWNETLISDVLPSAYNELLLYIITEFPNREAAQTLYNLLPRISGTVGRWRQVALKVWNNLKSCPIIYSQVKDTLLGFDEVVVTNSLSSPDREDNQTVIKALTELETPLVTLPLNVWETIKVIGWHVKTVTPLLLLEKLRVEGVCRSSWNKFHLLEYILSDENLHSQVEGVPLIPLENGNWCKFARISDVIYICTPEDAGAFLGLENRLLQNDVPKNIRNLFKILSQKGSTQLQIFDIQNHGPTLLAKSVDAVKRLKSNKSEIRKWLSYVWKMLHKHNIPLRSVAHLKLIPTKSNPSFADLIPFTEPFIVQTDSIPNNNTEFQCLHLLGIKLIRLPEYVKHQEFHEFSSDTTPSGIIKVINRLIQNHDSSINCISEKFNKNKREEDCFSLTKIIPYENLPAQIDNLIRNLDIFKATDSKGRQILTSLNKCTEIYPEISHFPLKLPKTVLHIRNDREMILAKTLGAKTLTEKQLCLYFLRENKSPQIIKTLVPYIFNDQTLKYDTEIQGELKKTKCIQNESGDFHFPCEIYDSEDALSSALLGEKLLTHISILEHLPLLRTIGLKKVKEIDSKSLIRIINFLPKITLGKTEKRKKIISLLSLVDTHKESTEICRNIFRVPCIPGDEGKPKDYPITLDWNTKDKLYSPQEVKSRTKFENTLGSVTPLFTCDMFSNLAVNFEWDEKPSANIFVQHLRNIITHFQDEDNLFLSQLRHSYMELNSFVNTHQRGALNVLMNIPFILTRHGLKKPSEVYLNENRNDLDLRPYFSPPLLKPQKEEKLFSFIGCKTNQSKEIYLELLEYLQIQYDSEDLLNSLDTERDINLVIQILEKLANLVDDDDDDVGRLLVPVEKNNCFELVPIKQTFYSDQSFGWLNFENEQCPEMKIVHRQVSTNLARKLNVPSLQKQLRSGGVPFMKWGQKQSLTSRIKDLLDQYKDGVALLKELVQNADDAGAESVCFMYDERENEQFRKGCMTNNLEEFQGPALWAYNDKIFSKSDLENIVKLGGRTKEEQLTKIGKFGLGFCSVYNITDVPSFISGSNYVVFDPHMTYIDEKDPGIRYDFSKDKRINYFVGQFKPFEGIFDCDVISKGFYHGTLFRFPLRTPSQAARSEISNIAYGNKEMAELLKMFMSMAGNLLLFTQNIKSIKVFHLDKYATSPHQCKLMYKIQKETLHVKQLVGNTFQSSGGNKTQVERAAEVISNLKCDLQESLLSNISIDISVTGKSMCALKEGSLSTSWIVSWHSGNSSLIEQAKQLKTLPLGAVAVPVLKKKDGWMPVCLSELPTGFYSDSHIHCFLPLAIKTSFPVNVNGYFEVASDRRSLKMLTSDDRCGGKDWNRELICHSIAPAYSNLLLALKVEEVSSQYEYYSLWPLQKQGNDRLQKELAVNFYKEICNLDVPVLCDKGKWYPLSQCLFLKESFYSRKGIGNLAFEFLDKYYLPKKKIIFLPQVYVDEFGKALEGKVISNEDFFLNYFLPNIAKNYIQEEERNALVLFAVDNGSSVVRTLLSEIECIATKPFNKLQKPSSLIHPEGQVANLYSIDDEKFPHEKFMARQHTVQVLTDLGMRQRVISDEMVLERAQTVQNISCAHCAVYRSKNLVHYLSNMNKNLTYLQRFSTMIQNKTFDFESLKNISFLPVKSKSIDWECKWAGDTLQGKASIACKHHEHDKNTIEEMKFAAPIQLYIPNLEFLIGCTELILQSDFSDFNILSSLGIKTNFNQISCNTVIQQLNYVSSDVSNKRSKWLLNTCEQIYDYFEKSLQEPAFMSQACQFLKEKSVFLTKEAGFQNADHFASGLTSDCSPDLFSTNREILCKYPNLIRSLEINNFFGPRVVCDVLKNKATQKGDTALSEIEIHQFSKLLTLLSQELKEAIKSNPDIVKELHLENIRIPDKLGVLKPSGSLCTDDVLDNPSKKFSIVHAQLTLSQELSEWLGIKSITRKRLQESSNRIPFGQNELLTTRLRNILDDYPCDGGIMKELLQNADDAGATEISFITDFRNHPTRHLFDEKYAPLQGPALCVYNNSCFSEKDLAGITNLGDSSKKKDPASTGQYGIGFNAVYHLTDAPSFLTRGAKVPHGELLCMFDPLCCYDPESTLQNPGVQFRNLEELRQLHPDSFKGYMEDDIMKGDGTLFRLPLRTIKNNILSKEVISNELWSPEKLEAIVKSFKEDMQKSLLFLKNIRKITIVKYLEDGNKNVEYVVESSVDKSDKKTIDNLKKYIKKYASKDQTDNSSLLCSIPPMTFSFDMQVKDSENNSLKWRIVHQLGAADPKSVPDDVKSSFGNGELKLLPHGGVALLLDKQPDKYVSQVVSCYLPLPIKSGLPFSIHGHFALNSSRRNLWTSTGEDSKSHWNQWILHQVVTPAVANAIEYYRLQKLPQNKSSLSEEEYIKIIKSYHNILPNITHVNSEYWSLFVKHLYSYIVDKSLHFFDVFVYEEEISEQRRKPNVETSYKPKNGKLYWYPLKGQHFPVYFAKYLRNPIQSYGYSGFSTQPPILKLEDSCVEEQFLNTLKNLGMKIGNNALLQRLKGTDLHIHMLTPDTVMEFLKTWDKEYSDSCQIKVDIPVNESHFQSAEKVSLLIGYLANSNNLIANLNTLPLLVTEDNILRTFKNESPAFFSRFHKILPQSSNEFISHHLFAGLQKVLINMEEKLPSSLKEFRIPDFAQRIHQEVGDNFKANNNDKIIFPEGIDNWLHGVWDFIESDIPKIKQSTVGDVSAKADWKEGKKYLLKYLGDWFLYPIIFKGTNFVVPIKFANKVLNCSTLQDDSPFKKIPVAVPNFNFKQNRYSGLSASLSEPSLILDILDTHHDDLCLSIQHGKNNSNVFHRFEKYLTNTDASNILKYFAENNKDNLDKNKLRHLPLYIDITGNISSIDGKETIVLPSAMDAPTEGIKELGENLRHCILPNGPFLNSSGLYKYLGFSFFETTLDLYSKFILPNLGDLQEKFHLVHLKHLQMKLQHICLEDERYWQDNERSVINILRNTRYIKFNGTFCLASEFYDPSNKIFKVMNMSTLPEFWSSFQWKNFLILSGMVNKVTPQMFIEITKKFSNEKEKLSEKSRTLVQYLFDNMDQFYAYTSEIKSIEFILPYIQKGLQGILPHYHTNTGLISFNGAVLPKFSESVWTASSLLPPYAEPPGRLQKQNIYQQLGINTNPSAQIVVPHLKRLTNYLIKSCAGGDGIEEIMEKIYEFLSNCEETIIQDILKECVPLVFIPEHKTSVTPACVVVNLEKEIIPYLFKFPMRYGKFLRLFEDKFKVDQTANCDKYTQVLCDIHNIIEEKEMNPEELRSLYLAMNGLIKDPTSLSTLTTSSLYLPTRTKHLKLSTSLCVADNQELENCVKKSLDFPLFAGFSQMKIQMEDAQFVKLLPESLRPKFLSDVLIEVLCSTEIDDSASAISPLVVDIQRFLMSEVFIRSIMRIMNHFRILSGHGLTKAEESLIINKHKSVKVLQVKSIETNLILNGESFGLRQRRYFIEMKNNTLERTLYMSQSSMKLHAIQGLTEIYENILGISDSHFVTLLHFIFFLLDNPENINSHLDSQNIQKYGDVSFISFSPEIGSYLDPKFLYCLDLGFYNFHNEEIVAMEKYSINDDDQDQDIFIIVQVKQLVKDSKELMQSEYEVDIGNATIVVLASQLYKFVRNKGQYNDQENYSAEVNSSPEVLHESSLSENVICITASPNHENGTYPERETNSEKEMSEADIMKSIRQQLIEIWKVTDERQRSKLVKRLYLKWHPDKNPDKIELCTACFKYLKNLIERLERGESIPEDEDHKKAPRETGSDKWNDFFRKSDNQWGNFFRESNNFHHNHRGSNRGNERRKTPDRPEANNWMKQAKHKYKAAQDENNNNGSNCGIADNCFQAVSTALRAALFLEDREKAKSLGQLITLTSLAQYISFNINTKSDIMNATREMEERVQLRGDLRFPTHLRVPCDMYQKIDSQYMLSKANKVLDIVQQRFL